MRVIFLFVCLIVALPLYAQKTSKSAEPVKDPISCSMLTDGVPCVIGRQMQHHRESVGSFKADFQREITDSQLKVTDIEKGRITYLKEEGLHNWKIKFVSPKKQTIAIEGGTKYHSYDPASGLRHTGAVRSVGSANLFSILRGNVQPSLLEQIKPADLTYEEIAPGTRAWHFRTDLGDKGRKVTDVWVEDGMVVKASVEIGTTKNTYLLTNIKKNVPVKKDAFKIETSIVVHVLDKMTAHRKELFAIIADIKTTVTGAGGVTDQVSEGNYRAIFPSVRNRNIQRIEWKDSIYHMQSGKYLIYRPAENTKQRGEVTTHPLSLALTVAGMDAQELKASFPNIHYLGREPLGHGLPTWHLKLELGQSKSIGPVEIWVDKDGMVVQIKISEADGAVRTVLFSNIQKNVRMDTEIFRIKMPKDVKLVN